MSASLKRTMMRKQARDMAKKGFQTYSQKHREIEAWARLKIEMRDDYKKHVKEWMPRWQKWLVWHLPPAWYERLLGRVIGWLLEMSSPKMIYGHGLSPWRMRLNRTIPVVMARLLHVIGMMWIMWIRRGVSEFGFRLTSHWTDDYHVRVELRWWRETIYERTYELKRASSLIGVGAKKLWLPGQ